MSIFETVMGRGGFAPFIFGGWQLTRRMIVPALFGLIGAAVLVWLGVWQLQRLEWKTAILDEISAKMRGPVTAIPVRPDEGRDEFSSVATDGTLLKGEIHVLTSQPNRGPGFRVIQRLDLGGRVILMDRGFIAQSLKNDKRPLVSGHFEGNLLWPDEIDPTFTPDPDLKANIWFARDVPAMAKALGAEPVLMVLRQSSETQQVVVPWPVDSAGIANNHFQYALTWFSLALGWLGMTVYLLWRIRRKLD